MITEGHASQPEANVNVALWMEDIYSCFEILSNLCRDPLRPDITITPDPVQTPVLLFWVYGV